MFTKEFGSYVCDGDSIDCVVDGVTYTARLAFDSDTKVDEFDYPGDAIEAWNRDEWHYFSVVIDAERDGWVKCDLASLSGVEGNFPGSDNAYLLEVANQLLPEAIELVKKDALS